MPRRRAPRSLPLVLPLALAVAGCASWPSPAGVDPAVDAAVVARARAAVVGVRAHGERSNGVLVSDEGLVLTVRHGLIDPEPVVELADGGRVRARVAYRDPIWDLAVLALPPRRGGYPTLALADGVRTADPVLVVARQDAYPRTVVRRGLLFMQGINLSSRDSDYGGGWTVENAYVHGAPVRTGHSGSALLDEHGRLLGINVAGSAEADGAVTLALPVASYRPLLARIEREQAGALPHVAGAAGLDLEDPAQRCAWVLDGLERHARHAGVPADQAAQLMAGVRREALSLYLAGDLDAETLVPWSWRQGLAVLGLATTRIDEGALE